MSNKNIKQLFSDMSTELENVNIWLKANKLSLNVDKTKYMLFHNINQSDNLPIKLPKLIMNSIVIEQVSYIKFLGILVDENLLWEHHIKLIESRISRVIGLMYKVRPFLNSLCL